MATKMGTLGEAVQTNDSDKAISQRVIEGIADAKGVDPLDLPPLYDTIDPDALDALFGSADSLSPITDLRFEVEGCEVRIEGSGDITITHIEAEVATSDSESEADEDTTRNAVEYRCGINLGGNGQLDTHDT